METLKGQPADVLPPELGLDFHNHLLPLVDDGMASYQDARLTIEKLQELGFLGAVLTPHVYHGVFDNDADKLRNSFDSFIRSLREDAVAFALHLAGEYFADGHFLKLIEKGDLLHIKLGNERLVLLEFSYLQETPYASACLAALVACGYRPVVAHVERYRFVAQAPERWLELFLRYGAVLQGDIGSLAGQHGEAVKRFARWLLERNLIPLWGTDVHHPRQIERHIVPGLLQLNGAGRFAGRLNPMLVGMAT